MFGHENLGIVQEVGDAVTSIKQGDRVVMPFNVACGFCKNCIAGYTAFCLTVNPGFAGGAYGYVAMSRTGRADGRLGDRSDRDGSIPTYCWPTGGS